ncbi:MAG: hypothetical protein VX663_08825 [Pseudomonadota bacterium]|nr:hypothetical protein [Pseudomonadota bacterium]
MGGIERLKFADVKHRYSEEQVRANTRNMLVDGCNIGDGTEVLVVNEYGRTEPALADIIEQECRGLGARVHVLWSDPVTGPDDMPRPVVSAFEHVDVTIFNHMIAGLLRCVPFNGTGLKMLNFLTTWDTMGSPFGSAPYAVWLEVLKKLAPRMMQGKEWRITCPLGTDYRGRHEPAAMKKPEPKTKGATGDGFTMRTFPLGVSPQYDALKANGTLAIQWLTPSGIHAIDGLALPSPVLAQISDGHMTGFEGDAAAVAMLKNHLETCGKSFGKDPYVVNSWHAGINPTCVTPISAREDLNEWMFMAHANPRIVHLHSVGEESPGELSIPIIDPTIEIDGDKVWEGGRLRFLEDPGLREIIAQIADPQVVFAQEMDIGV